MMLSETDVIVVGAGPVGLALAIELGSRGVRCVAVERNDRIGIAPRAKTCNVRTRTHLRRWGIADQLAEASPFGVDYPSDVVFVTRLNGKLLCRIPNASNCAPDRSPFYPEHGQWIPQYKLAEVLRAHAETLDGVDIRLATEFVSAEQDESGVTVTLRDVPSREETTLRCAYLVGADGARSSVRNVIGARMKGEYGLSRNYNVVFRAPGLAAAHPHGPATMYWQISGEAPGLIGPMDKDDVWFFMPTKLPPDTNLSGDAVASLLRRATGIDLDYQVLSSDEWVASRLIADRYRDGRIFLAGDACHLHPPFGGFGMNMGISDAVDLGWKVAACLHGWGGAALLESYQAERRPVHEAVMAEAVANHSVLSNDFRRDGLEDDTAEAEAARAAIGEAIGLAKEREFHTLGTVLGLCYESSPVIVSDREVSPSRSDEGAYVPSTRPGCLAPHLWLSDGRSLYDQFREGFSVVIGPNVAHTEAHALLAEATRDGIPLSLVDLTQEQDAVAYRGRLTLIRPDQHVAWHGSVWIAGLLAVVTGQASREQADRGERLKPTFAARAT